MEQTACKVIYVDRRAREQTVRRTSISSEGAPGQTNGTDAPAYKPDGDKQELEVQSTLESLLTSFTTVHLLSSGSACLAKLTELESSTTESTPVLVLIDIPYDEEQKTKRWSRDTRTPSPTFSRDPRSLARSLTAESMESADIYGFRLLSHVASEIQFKKLSKLIIPIAVVSGFEREWAPSNVPSPSVHGSQVLSDGIRLTRFIDAGAIDVLVSPISRSKAQSLTVVAYRTLKDVNRQENTFLASRASRKLSWVGVQEEKPYAYLREAMVSNLMSGICNWEDQSSSDIHPSNPDFGLDESKQREVADAVGQWSFSAHEYTNEELQFAALSMLEHALSIPELEKWHLSRARLNAFIESCYGAYNEFVDYHNFRHAVDVMQAVFVFLLQLSSLPQHPAAPKPPKPSPLASLINPFDALTLLISCIGHDVGHPGVNNAFLVALNAPLAQLYNDRSVLESFHCAAYSQILRRHWKAAFGDSTLRRLMINSILATDMGLHFKFMADLGNLQQKLGDNPALVETLNAKEQEEYRDLLCGVLIKCADISNVARVFPVAHQWANILTEEFANQGRMENDLGIPTTLFGGPPTLGDIVKLGESQQGFMNIFARPLFESVTDVLPAMQFCVDELDRNKVSWEQRIADETSPRCDCDPAACTCRRKDSHADFSPKSSTPASSTWEQPLDPHRPKSMSDPEVFSNSLLGASSSITATALPLSVQLPPAQIAALLNRVPSHSAPALGRGDVNGNKFAPSQHHTSAHNNQDETYNSSPALSSLAISPAAPHGRAVSAHQANHSLHPSDNTLLPNGVGARHNFAASDVDVRLLNGRSPRSNEYEDSPPPTSKSGMYFQHNDNADSSSQQQRQAGHGKRNSTISQSFRRFWRRKRKGAALDDSGSQQKGKLENIDTNQSVTSSGGKASEDAVA